VRTNSPIFNILNIDHVVVLSHNVKKSLQFYCDVLGMAEVRRVDTVGLIQLRAGVSMIDILPARPNDNGRNIDHFALRIDPWEPEKIISHLKSAGYTPGPPALRVGAEGNGWSIYVQDPDGITVELKGPPI
jgi:glyoxylase I family protein